MNGANRTDVEGCCWWGRGVIQIQTTGVCNYGMLNYYLGKRALMKDVNHDTQRLTFVKTRELYAIVMNIPN